MPRYAIDIGFICSLKCSITDISRTDPSFAPAAPSANAAGTLDAQNHVSRLLIVLCILKINLFTIIYLTLPFRLPLVV